MPLSIKIDANTGSLNKSIEELKMDLVQFKATLDKATDTQTISRLNKSIKETEASLKAIRNISPDLGKNIVPGAERATTSIINLSRVVQDAPYGIIGFANNIDPLLDSFRRLRIETGSTSGALRAFGSSLLGAGGLSLAVSLVTTGLVLFAQHSQGAKKELEGWDKAIKSANDSAGEQIARVKILSTVITDSSRSHKDHSRAAGELSGILKELNVTMTQEEILNGKVKTATDLATAAILKRAQAVAIENRLGELSGQNLARDIDRKRINAELIDIQKKYNKEVADSKRLEAQGGPKASANVETQIALEGTIKQLADLGTETAKANEEINFLLNRIRKEDSNVKLDIGKEKESLDLLKQRIDALKDLQSITGLDLAQKIELSQLEVALINRDGIKMGFKPSEMKEKIQAKIDEIFPPEFTNFRIRGVFVLEPTETKVQTPKALTDGVKFDIAKATGINKIVIPTVDIVPGTINTDFFANAIGDAFGESLVAIGNSLGEAMASGDFASGFEGAAKAILGIIGGVLIEVGKEIIVTSTLVQGLKKALTGLFANPAAGIAIGIALVATGSLLKNVAFPKMADGGILTQSTMFQGGEAGKEAVIPLAKLPYLMNQQSNGGGGSTTIGLRIKGRELLAFLEREKQYAKRLS